MTSSTAPPPADGAVTVTLADGCTSAMHCVNPKEVAFLSNSRLDEYGLGEYLLTDTSVAAVVLDVGANIGAFASRVLHAYPNATLHCFEPMPELFAALSKNVTANPRAQCHQLAVMPEKGTLEATFLPNYTLLSGFYVSDADEAELTRLAGRSLAHEFERSTVQVQCVRLDAFCEERGVVGEIDLLKIDVEKAELDVLASLGGLAARVRAIVAEVHGPNLGGYLAWLEEHGFDVAHQSRESLPVFCLDGHAAPADWDKNLSTQIVIALRRNA